MKKNSKKYIIYLRQSKKDNSFHTFDVQLKGIESFAKTHGIDLDMSEAYCRKEEASAYSGKRSEFIAIMELLEKDKELTPENRKYNGIIFYNVSRIARNLEDFLRIEKLMWHGYKMLSATENIIDSASGMYIFRMMQIESIYYSDRQSSKMQIYNLHILFNNPYKGIGWVGVTYGYDINEDNTIILHPINSEIVKRIFHLRKEGTPHEEIYSILKKEFTNKVNTYNRKNGGHLRKYKDTEKYFDEDMYETITEDLSDILEDASKNDYNSQDNQEKGYPAHIPNAKKISVITNDTGRIRYHGERRYTFDLNFEEDARLQNDFLKMGHTPFRFENGDKFIKGTNLILLEVPKLEIIPKDIYEQIVLWAIKRRHVKSDTPHTYNGVLFCKCGSEITAKIEAKRVYYRCLSAVKWDGCDRTTRITEENIDGIIEEQIFAYLSMEKSGNAFKELVIASKKYSIEHLKYRLRTASGNLTKFKSALKSATNAKVYQEYTEKIEKTESEIDDINEQIEDMGTITERQLSDFFKYMNDFHLLDSATKQLMVSFMFERIVLDEIHEEAYIYHNPYNRISKSIQYKKLLDNIQLIPYLQELYILNRFHGWV